MATMKLRFEPNLGYQCNAWEAVADLFRGQETCRTEFTVAHSTSAASGAHIPGMESGLGIGNRLKLLDDEILANLRDVQLRNGLPHSESVASGDFTVEMETGTGKTYVYLRTIFELNKRYGFTKFVIVVPSIAIKEGVYKTIQITEDHFRNLYANTPFEYFLYDSRKPGQVRNFASSPHIQIMVVTVGAINKKDVNNLYKENENYGGEKPIDLVRDTCPIIIVDEPQSVDGGLRGRGKEALGAMNPLCTLRYSATHVDKHHMVYRLDAVDAYEQKLVKQIEVASAGVEGGHNRPYVKMLSASNLLGTISAKVELDIEQRGGVSRKPVNVQDGDDLEQVTGRAIYADHRIGEIRAGRGQELLELRVPGNEHWLAPGHSYGDVDDDSLKRQMIRRTIKEHLDKELRLRPQGIKVLSLFFIDVVHHYRQYDEDGNPQKGKYALMFEEEYRRLIRHPDYHTLFKEVDVESEPAEVHDGYFSIDKKGSWTDTAENNQTNRDSAERAYSLIMRDKEKLLSFDTKLKFIFSHSALREGWDNPNVFQICALRDMGTERERRQTIGRGLRLCVNQEGERLRGFDINTLTVIATESYERFATNLQKEIEADTGIRFGVVEKHQFAAIPITGDDGHTTALGPEQSEAIWKHLRELGLLDSRGKVQDCLREALKDNTLALPDQFKEQLPQVKELLKKLAGRLEIKNADEREKVLTRQAILDSADFKALWNRIKHKTTYRVDFDNEALIDTCAEAIRDCPPIPRTRLTWRKAELTIGRGGVDAEKTAESQAVTMQDADIELPDLLTDLQDKTQLTRRSLVRILIDSGRLDDFRKNPQQFIAQTAEFINRAKRLAVVDGIKYQRIGSDHYYAQEMFKDEELTGYLKNMLEVTKSTHVHVVFDSSGEKSFANDLEQNEAVKVYAKLPGWFRVPTPLGTYNPDWAVLIQTDEGERLYFVVETKGSMLLGDLRGMEDAKIRCAKVHFQTLAVGEEPAKYVVASKLKDVTANL